MKGPEACDVLGMEHIEDGPLTKPGVTGTITETAALVMGWTGDTWGSSLHLKVCLW